MSTIKAVTGLGNPDKRYSHTYHNLGKLFVESFEDYLAVPVIPLTDYMNLSGKELKKKLDRLRLNISRVLVVHDDSDLPFGTIRFYFDGSAAGHKGVRSITEAFGTNKFWRMRIGSRSQKPKTALKAGDFALRNIKTSELARFKKNQDVIAEHLDRFLEKPEKFTFRFV